MDYFHYNEGTLWCEGITVQRIADKIGTPLFLYSAATLREHYQRIAQAFAALQPIICYSIKSCSNIHICSLLRELGAGFDVVSGGELERALRAGGDPAKIVFAGVGKTDAEMEAGISANIGWFNIESEAELENLSTIATRTGRSVRAALRVNPDVDPKTHRYTTTGKKESKFGVDLERARRVFSEFGRSEAVRLTGIHLHIGSPVNSVEPYVRAIQKALGLIEELRSDRFKIDMLDIGGGFGAHYRSSEAPDAESYAAQIVPLLEPQVRGDHPLQIIMEPGRSIAANAGILVSRVLYLKKSGERDFLIADAGMTELIRPSLY
jgi:diaminopimelate decarboxylase